MTDQEPAEPLHRRALLIAIMIIGTQAKLAKMLDVKQQTVNYWLKRAKKVPFHQVMKIVRITNGHLTVYDFAPRENNPNEEN